MPEIRKCDNRALAHAQHLPQQRPRMLRFLQGLAQHHVIERVLGIVGESLVDIALIYRNAACDRALHPTPVQLDTARVYILLRRQPLQQLTFATAQIEHA